MKETDNCKKKKDFTDYLDEWTNRYYSINSKKRYKRACRKFAAYLASIWAQRYEDDPSMTEFTLTFYASERRQRIMLPNDFSLRTFTHGFNYQENSRAISLITRILYLRYHMHPADAYHRCITPDEEKQMLYDIIGAIPEEQLRLYDFKVKPLKIYKADYEMQPDHHWMMAFVFTRKESE